MDKQGFQTMLEGRKVPVEKMESADFNGIFRVDTTGGQKFILRVTLPEGGHELDHVTAEMDWLAALSRDTNLSMPRPLPARDGRAGFHCLDAGAGSRTGESEYEKRQNRGIH